jgi:3-oxoadipate enol-lactonase
MVNPIPNQMAALRGIEVAYARSGEHGTPVVLIMGYGMSGSAWRLQVPTLARRHRVLTFDNRGAGATRAQAGLFSMRLLAEDTGALMDHVGFEHAHVVGISMGGMIAQEFALRFRSRVRSLTLIATHAGGLRNAIPPMKGLQLFMKAQRHQGAERVAAVERLLFPPEYLESCDRARLREILRADFGKAPPAAMRYSQLAAVLRHRTAGRLRALEGMSTLIIRPGRDLLIHPRESDRLHALIPGARLVRYDDAGHGLLRQHSEKLAEELLAHFSAADASDA